MDHLVLCQEPEPDHEQFLRTLENLILSLLNCAVNKMYQLLALF